MKWFGPTWGAPCCDPKDHVATPVGDECLRCEKPIVEGAQGFIMPIVHSAEKHHLAPYHLDCLMAAVLPCPGCEHCRPGDPRNGLLASAFAASISPTSGPASSPAALFMALKIQRDPTNRAITCPCGVTYLSGAAEKDAQGRPLCIACGRPFADDDRS